MKFTINSRLLRNSLESAQKAIPSKSSTPILGNFLLKGDGSYLKVTGSDANITIIQTIPSDATGEAVVPTNLLDLMRVLPDDDVAIEVDNGACKVSWKNGNSTLPTFDPKDYPDIKIPEGVNGVTILADIFSSAIAHTVQFTDADELRPAFSGVFLNVKTDHIDVVSTDSRVLAIYKINRELPEEPFSLIIPATALNAVRGAIKDAREIGIAADETSILMQFGNTTVISRKIVGKFPNYESIIPSDFLADLTARKADFLDTFKRVAVCASKAAGTLKLVLNPLTSSVEAQDMGFATSAREEPESFKYQGPEITIGFRDEYLIKAVSAIESETVTVRLNGARKAAIIEGENDPCTILLMPVQI